jgi:Tol biopolymer transport system component
MIKTFIGFDRICDEDPKMNISPDWSPDRREIVFANDSVGGRIGNFEIFKLTLGDHNSLRRLTFRNRVNSEPAFSPDGSRILFVSDQDGYAEIYLMNSDGTGHWDLLEIQTKTNRRIGPLMAETSFSQALAAGNRQSTRSVFKE